MDLSVNVKVHATELPNRSSIGYGIGLAPDGSPIRFYDDWSTISDLQDEIDKGITPEIYVPSEHAILTRRHWAA